MTRSRSLRAICRSDGPAFPAVEPRTDMTDYMQVDITVIQPPSAGGETVVMGDIHEYTGVALNP